MDKIDGATLLYTKKGNVEGLYTRGGGDEGESMDVSHIIPYLKLPKLSFDVVIRGEVVLYNSDFAQLNTEYVNPRSMMSGMLTAKKSFQPQYAAYLHFIAFRIVESSAHKDLIPEDQIYKLREYGFETPMMVPTSILDRDALENYLVERRKQAPYNMDGLVIYENILFEYPVNERPKHVVAFKIASEMAETVVLAITWKPSKDRRLKPVAIIQPVRLVESTNTKATANNANYVITHGLGPGAKVIVSKRGDIIPHIEAVLEPSPTGPSKPDPAIYGEYVWDKYGTDYILLSDTFETIIARIADFMSILGIKDISEKRIKALMVAGYQNLKAILEATPEQFADVLGPTLGPKLYQDIHYRIQNVPLSRLLGASNVFPNMKEKRFDAILDEYPNIVSMYESIYSHYLSLSKDNQAANEYYSNAMVDLEQKIRGIRGFNELAVTVVTNLPVFRQWLLDHSMVTYVLPQKIMVGEGATARMMTVKKASGPNVNNQLASKSNTKLSGKKIVLSGTRNPTLQELLINSGAEIVANMSGRTTAQNTILVIKDSDIGKNNTKEREARTKGIPTIPFSEFVATYFPGVNF
jgi:NAD-dependent DNA ligase